MRGASPVILFLFELCFEVVGLFGGQLPEVRTSAQLAIFNGRAYPSHHLLDGIRCNQGPQFARMFAAANLSCGNPGLEKALAGKDNYGFIHSRSEKKMGSASIFNHTF